MTTSSEDVLMQVGQVRYKKGDGTLYVMNERIAWMLDNRDTVSVSHKYADIKCKNIRVTIKIMFNKRTVKEKSYRYKFTALVLSDITMYIVLIKYIYIYMCIF